MVSIPAKAKFYKVYFKAEFVTSKPNAQDIGFTAKL